MPRSFNTTGPNIESEHYMIAPLSRLGRITLLIEQKKYFVLRAGRQVGKTTSAQVLVNHLNQGDTYCALWVDLQTAREQPDVPTAMKVILEAIRDQVRIYFPQILPTLQNPSWSEIPERAVINILRQLCSEASKPMVIFFDEADCLVGPTMVSFLTQLRNGYIDRANSPFPHSIILTGQRDIRDYLVTKEEGKALSWLGTASPFNITAESVSLSMFTPEQVKTLLLQHTEETGQVFDPEAINRVYELTNGHPWLVNALADYSVMTLVKDRTLPVKKEHIEQAKESIIISRRTHIDSLMARLREPRVVKILSPMLAGLSVPHDMLDDDLSYVEGMGLVRVINGQCEIANPIYKEVVPRALTYMQQIGLYQKTAWYVLPDGSLDIPKLMTAWQKFWRKDGHEAAEGFAYREAGPHLMMMAFLQRIVNCGAQIDREYALGKGALDLLVRWVLPSGDTQSIAIELKLRRDTDTEQEAIEQLIEYLDLLGLTEGWLILFDLRKALSWEEKIIRKDIVEQGKTIHLVGC